METCLRLAPSELDKLIGTPYVLGKTDCGWMVLSVLQSLGIEAPDPDPDWYSPDKSRWLRDLIIWGDRITKPEYDGDVFVEPLNRAFCIVWRHGFFHICPMQKVVSWSPLKFLNEDSFRMNGASSRLWAFRKKNIEKFV